MKFFGFHRVLLLVIFASVPLAIAHPALAQYAAPTQITVNMHRLDTNTGALYQSEELCYLGSMQYGCTADPNYGGYPWSTANITVLIEGTVVDNRYLRDVVPSEVSIAGFHPTAV